MKKVIIILILAIGFMACSDSFLDTENKNNLDVGSFFKTENDVLLAVNSAYTPLQYGIDDQWNSRGMFGLTYLLKMNVLDPYIWFENPKAGLDQMVINTSDFKPFWNALYMGLFRTSDIIANIDRVKDVVDPERLNEYKGQLQALRGMYYFYLVTWFNEPIYYDETSIPMNPLVGLSNGKPEQFWTKLEEDLMNAAQNLPAVWSGNEVGRITSGAANAQLGKALLYKHYHYYLRYDKGSTPEAVENLKRAKEALKRVIDSHVYHLILPVAKNKANYQAALLSNFSYLDIPVGDNTYKAENNAESVWEIQFNDDDRGASGWLPGQMWGGALNYAYMSPIAYRNLEIDPTLWYEFETNGAPVGFDRDPRAYATCYLEGDLLDWRAESGRMVPFQSSVHAKSIVANYNLYSGPVPSKAIGVKKYFYPQFVGKSSPNCDPINIRVIRYADVLLMYAEACYQIDHDADGSGLAALNEVRARVDMPPVNALTPAAIVHERTVELATEGHHYNDIVRWMWDPNFEMDLSLLFNNKFSKEKNYCFPIPQADIDANKGALKQNPGW
jgi:hypothetical protein